jgi:chaperone modulatory protein CbpM
MTTIDIEKFLQEAGMELQTLQQWIEREWIIPAPVSVSASIELTDVDVARVIFIRDLRSDFGVNDEGVEVVLHLVDQLHGLRRAMRNLRMALHESPHPETGIPSGRK